MDSHVILPPLALMPDSAGLAAACILAGRAAAGPMRWPPAMGMPVSAIERL